MSMVLGDAKTATAGMAKRIYDNMVADPDCGFSSPLAPAQALGLQALCNAIAKGVIDEIQANAETTIDAEGIA